MVSAICPNCKILLVEANSSAISDLAISVNTAASLGATAISNSYGASEWSGETGYFESFYNHPGIAVTASAGDAGYGVEFPAATGYTIAVGGTTLNQATNTGSRNATETVWSGSGSGCSAYEPKPSWQHDSGCGQRTVADVAAIGDPATGVWVYDSTPANGQSGWMVFGGTSVSAPIIGSIYALAANGSAPSARNLYASGAPLFDVTSGSNGSCGGTYLCTGVVGYDGPTGNGTANGLNAFNGSSSGSATNTPTLTPTPTNTPTQTPTATNTPTSGGSGGGSVLFGDGFESGNFSAWSTTTATGSGSASVSTTTPYVGSDDGYFTRSSTAEVGDKAGAIERYGAVSGNVVWARAWVRVDSAPTASYFNIDNLLQVDDMNSLNHPKARFGVHSGGKLFYSYLKKDGTWFQADWGTLTLGQYYGLKVAFDMSGANPVVTWYVNTGSSWVQVASYTDTSSGTLVLPNELRVGAWTDNGITHSDPSYAGTARNRIDEVVISPTDPN
jgi:hypothetical protein